MLQESHDLDSQDIQFLTTLASDTKAAQIFWTTCFILQPLVDYGHWVLSWLHSCSCGCDPKDTTKNPCPLKGRRSIELACGKARDFLAELQRVHLSKWATEAHSILRKTDLDLANNLLNDYQTAKAKIHLRISQSLGYWEQPPWSILRVGECLVRNDPWNEKRQYLYRLKANLQNLKVERTLEVGS